MFPSLDNGPFSATTATGEQDSNPLQPALGMTSCKTAGGNEGQEPSHFTQLLVPTLELHGFSNLAY
jgi:hypothetical protein